MMNKIGIDQEALVNLFAESSAKQGEVIRKAVSEVTLKALQGRELTLANIRTVLKQVTQAASMGVAQNPAGAPDIEAMLSKAMAGMDAALLQAVEANRRALQQFVDQGVGLSQGKLQGALADLEKMESTFFASVTKAAQSAGEPLQGPWNQVLSTFKQDGSQAGAQASAAVEQLVSQTQSALRDSRALGLKTAQALVESYSALVSGVLIGMSEGLQGGAAASDTKPRKK